MLDILKTGKYGVLANQKLLGTTSNNISNVNTEGYVRQNTQYYTSVIDWGIGESYTRRMYDQYVQRELFRDQASSAFYESYISGMDSIDKMLTDDSMSISSSLNDYFDALQEAVQNPTSTATRRELLSQLGIMTDRYQTLNYSITNELHDVNSKIQDQILVINDLVEGIYNINKQIISMADEQSDMALQLKDKRDLLVTELSEYVDLNLNVDTRGSYELYLSNGQMLLNSDAYAVISTKGNEYDKNKLELQLAYSTNPQVKQGMSVSAVGGSLGGLLQSTDEIRQTMRDLGQLAVAFADALNVQNKSGITLENKAGDDLITIKQPVAGVSNNGSYAMECSFIEGLGENVTANDYKVTFNSHGELTVSMIENGKSVVLTAGEDYDVTADNLGNMVLNMPSHGITMTFSASQANMEAAGIGNGKLEFYVQPTMHAAYDIELNASKPEDFAFAAAVRTNTGSDNIGNAVISLESMTQTGTDFGVSINADGNPEFNAAAPVQIVIDDDGNYEVRAADGTTLGTAPASCNGKNVFAHTVWLDTTLPDGYPGYDVSVTGTVSPRDSFDIEINTDGFSDNTNGIQLGLLQTANTVASSGSNKVSFTEGYADMTAALGSALLSANTDLTAAQTKLQQTQELYSSSAGVNLDEEAANLIRFQQSYTACSKIITASQTVFDALLSAF